MVSRHHAAPVNFPLYMCVLVHLTFHIVLCFDCIIDKCEYWLIMEDWREGDLAIFCKNSHCLKYVTIWTNNQYTFSWVCVHMGVCEDVIFLMLVRKFFAFSRKNKTYDRMSHPESSLGPSLTMESASTRTFHVGFPYSLKRTCFSLPLSIDFQQLRTASGGEGRID